MERGVEHRKPEHSVAELFLNRWSPRALADKKVSEKTLASLFEAAKWAPSAYNEQPWRFLYALKDSPSWKEFFDLLVAFNQSWAERAGALVVILSRRRSTHNENALSTHSFDAGAAWENFALQATSQGLVAHAMSGFDYERARKVLRVPEVYAVEAMVAVGWPGAKELLPEALREEEVPSQRKSVEQIAFKGVFPKDTT